MFLTTHNLQNRDFWKLPAFPLVNLLIFISTVGIKSLTDLTVKVYFTSDTTQNFLFVPGQIAEGFDRQ